MIICTVSDAAIAEGGRSGYQHAAEKPVRLTVMVAQPDGYKFAVGVQIPSVPQFKSRAYQDKGEVINLKVNAKVFCVTS